MKKLLLLLSLLSFYSLGISQTITAEELHLKLEETCGTNDSSVINKLEEILKIYEQNKMSDISIKIETLYQLCKKKVDIGYFRQALTHIEELELLLPQSPNTISERRFYILQGDIFVKLKKWKTARSAYQNAIKQSQLLGDSTFLGIAIALNAYVRYHLGEKEAAISDYNRAIELQEQYGTIADLMTTKNNLSVCYLYENKPDLAISIFEELLVHHQTSKNNLNLAKTYGNLGYTHSILQQYPQGFSYYDSCITIAQREGYKETEYIAYLDQSETYATKGDFKNAYHSYKNHLKIKENVQNEAIESKITAWKVRYETEKKEKEIIALRERNTIVRQQRFLLIGGLIALGFIGFLVYKKKKNELTQQEALHEAQEKIILSELKRKSIEEMRLKEQLENKNKDLTNLSLDIVRKNDFSEELKRKLNELEEQLPNHLKTKIKDLQLFTNSHLQLNEDLSTLQTNVDKINGEFYEKLDALGKELSQTEKQLCGFILLNLSNKEIAVIRKISPNSAKVARYRLRKKLELAPEEDIVTFLRNV